MAKTALKVKAARKPKFAVRGYTRCQRCGRPKAVYRKFGLCRICLRELAHRGELPGVTKGSWKPVFFVIDWERRMSVNSVPEWPQYGEEGRQGEDENSDERWSAVGR